ncbi:MAG TPA: aminotransferase class V-fold PLP-dependent enzyme [Myxococcaceae bacterium]|nr:aminotransferase class V-fold PLP-dependent enzyme [Myxococcaceae bacterium]
MTPDEFRALGHQLIEWVAAYRERLPDLPVMSPVHPGDVRRHFASAPPERGLPLESLLPQLDAAIVPGITHWNHPGFFAYFPSNSTLPSVLADLVAAGLGAQGMSWQTSPAATELEEVAMEWLRQLVGLPPTFSGVIQDTASTATLVALLCARERTTGHGQGRGGLQAETAPLTVYASEMAHSSIEKAALLAGLGRDNLRLLPTDEAHALRPDALEEALRTDLAAGRQPCAIVATVGSTGTTAIDPVARIGELARAHGAWLHVDAAMAGTAMACPELRWMWDGVEQADSVVWNPHKWLGIGFDCTAYHVRDPDHLVRVMATDPSYLRTAQDGAVKNYRDWGIALGRRFRSLKVWFVLSAIGVEGIRVEVRRHLALARWLADQVDATPGWERLAPVPLQTVAFRHSPAGMGAAALDAHNLALARAINASGRAYLTPAVVKGGQLLRVSIGSTATTAEDVAALWARLRDTGATLAGRR